MENKMNPTADWDSNELTKNVILIPQPLSRVAEQRSDRENEAFQIQETSLGAVQLDQDGDDAAADRQTQLFVRIWEFSRVKKSRRESTGVIAKHTWISVVDSKSICNVI